MPMCTVSSKGQITLPARVRKELGIRPRDRVIVESQDGAIVIRRVPDFFALEGFLGEALPPDAEREHIMRAAVERALGSQR